jgi:hypothetical protein
VRETPPVTARSISILHATTWPGRFLP